MANECTGELALPYGYAGATPVLDGWAMDREGEMVRSPCAADRTAPSRAPSSRAP